MGAIASFVMVIVTYVTLRQNIKQLNELKRQWEEQNRPEIIFQIKEYRYVIWLEISNTGNSVASNIEFYFNEEFLRVLKENSAFFGKSDNVLKKNPIEQLPIDLVKGQKKSYELFIRTESVSDCILKTIIDVKGVYNGKYYISQKFRIEDFLFEEKDSINVLNDNVKSLILIFHENYNMQQII